MLMTYCSSTVTGPQSLIHNANEYIIDHGLSFNPKKSSCIVFGKKHFIYEPSWHINGQNIKVCDEIDYLGAVLSVSNKCQIAKRVQAFRKSFYNLQSAGFVIMVSDHN